MELKDKLLEHLALGKPIGGYPDGPLLERFEALELAQGIERECSRAEIAGLPKLRLDMCLVDARALADFLRRAVSSGVR